MSDDNMATMPIPDLVRGIREKAGDMPPMQAMVMGVLAGRLTLEYERANAAEEELKNYVPVHCDECGRDMFMSLLPTGPLPAPPEQGK